MGQIKQKNHITLLSLSILYYCIQRFISVSNKKNNYIPVEGDQQEHIRRLSTVLYIFLLTLQLHYSCISCSTSLFVSVRYVFFLILLFYANKQTLSISSSNSQLISISSCFYADNLCFSSCPGSTDSRKVVVISTSSGTIKYGAFYLFSPMLDVLSLEQITFAAFVRRYLPQFLKLLTGNSYVFCFFNFLSS